MYARPGRATRFTWNLDRDRRPTRSPTTVRPTRDPSPITGASDGPADWPTAEAGRTCSPPSHHGHEADGARRSAAKRRWVPSSSATSWPRDGRTSWPRRRRVALPVAPLGSRRRHRRWLVRSHRRPGRRGARRRRRTGAWPSAHGLTSRRPWRSDDARRLTEAPGWANISPGRPARRRATMGPGADGGWRPSDRAGAGTAHGPARRRARGVAASLITSSGLGVEQDDVA